MVIEDKWEWSSQEIKDIGYRVIDLIAEHLTTLPDKPVFGPTRVSLPRGIWNLRSPKQAKARKQSWIHLQVRSLPFPLATVTLDSMVELTRRQS